MADAIEPPAAPPSSPPSSATPRVGVDRPTALRILAVLLAVGALAVLVPLWAPLVLAAWIAGMMRPLAMRLTKRLGGRSRAAGTLTLALLILMMAPVVVAIAGLYGGGRELVLKLMESKGTKEALEALVSKDPAQQGGGSQVQQIITMVQAHGQQALDVLSKVAGATADVLLGVFVFMYGTFTLLVDGDRVGRWLEDHAPIAPDAFRRLAGAFRETGRGLVIGTGLTALTQGVVATIAYIALGVPRAILLGLFTTIAALIPSIGTGLVWVPIAVGLGITGRTTSALVLVAIGVGVISTVDNLVRPLFSRWGELKMNSFLFLVSVFGGLALVGTWGLVLGPLVVRLAMEALAIARERNLTGTQPST
ncbi:MAG: AI-2E family transporter [Polyangiaceae bacterium]